MRVGSVPKLVLEVIRLIEATVLVDGQPRSRYGSRVLVEEYLPGTELTITVMPPGVYEIAGKRTVHQSSWCLPPVRRIDHRSGVLPYSGEVPVSANSTALDERERRTPVISSLLDACAATGDLIATRAAIRIDCRQRADGVYHLFDLNMKPNLTGPGRPGRDDQSSLTTLAATAIGWSYRDLLKQMLLQAW
jgi:D-alanine-D-alanine ligase